MLLQLDLLIATFLAHMSRQTCESGDAVAVDTDVIVFTPWLTPPICLCRWLWLAIPATGDALVAGCLVIGAVVMMSPEMLLPWDELFCPTGAL